MISSLLIKKTHSFLRLPLLIQLGVLPTWIMLGVARLIVRCVPFRVIAPRLGTHAGVHPWSSLISLMSSTRARQIAQLIRVTARYCPWNANCFAQAITARCWLGLFRVPYVLYFGVAKAVDGQLQAHAWVCSGAVRVCGGDSFAGFTVVGVFASSGIDWETV